MQSKAAPENGTVCWRNDKDFIAKLLQYYGKAPEYVGQTAGLGERRNFRRDQGDFHRGQLGVAIGERFESPKTFGWVAVDLKKKRMRNLTLRTPRWHVSATAEVRSLIDFYLF